MKKTSNIHIAKAAVFLLAGALSLTSCKKDEEEVSVIPCTGQPSITKVTTSSDRATTIQGANMADWVIIYGSNFCDLEKITFNTLEVSLADAYVTANSITVKVPATFPTEITNKLTLFSKTGQAEYEFKIFIPAAPDLEVFQMKNEYTPKGDTMTIIGKNFYLNVINRQVSKVLFGTVEALVLSNSTDSTLLVKVPMTAQAGAVVKVIGQGKAKQVVQYTLKDVEATLSFPYQDNRHILFDGDTFIGWEGAYVSGGPQPKPIHGNYVRFSGITKEGWNWDQFAGSGDFTNTAIPDDAVQHPSAYLLKYEVYNKKSITKAILKIGISDNYVDIWDLKAVDTGWRTVTVPLSDLFKAPMEPSEKYMVQIAFSSPIHEEVDFSFDNLRIVPKP